MTFLLSLEQFIIELLYAGLKNGMLHSVMWYSKEAVSKGGLGLFLSAILLFLAYRQPPSPQNIPHCLF